MPPILNKYLIHKFYTGIEQTILLRIRSIIDSLIGKERTMKHILSLNEEVDDIIRKKSSTCNCKPCTCNKRKKAKYYQELQDTLARFNKEYLRRDLLRINN